MKVVLEADIFSDDPDTIRLDVLANLALGGWHRIILENEDAPGFRGWLDQLNRGHQERWREIIREGYVLEAREPARQGLRVTRASTDWGRTPPRASLGEAVAFLGRPFCVMLEDQVSDRDFLLKMATDDQRDALRKKEATGNLSFLHGGGISAMPRVIDNWLDEGARGSLRKWVLFDSDALQPLIPSEQSEILRSKCDSANIPHHQLLRRNIENYVPLSALSHWAFSSGSRRHRSKQFRAFNGLSPEQRAHYNMKEGFEGDVNRQGQNAGSLFDNLSGADRASLERGFGRDIGNMFSTDVVKEAHLRRDGSWDEVNPVVTDLIALLR
jgi:hypothetical protein